MDTKQIKGGLNYEDKGIRAFSSEKRFGSVSPLILPKEGLGRKPNKILNQETTDFCASFSGAAMRSYTEKINLDPYWLWAIAAYLRGSYTEWGLTLPQIAKALTKKGIVEEIEQPFNINNKDRDFLANIINYPQDLEEKAKKHIGGSYFWVQGPYDNFDNIRNTLYLNRGKDLVVITGCEWKMSWLSAEKGIIKEYDPKEMWFGHAFIFIDFKEIDGIPYLIGQLSSGEGIGDKGLFYFSREIVNSPLFRFGSLIITDDNPEAMKKLQWGFIQILTNYIAILKILVANKVGQIFYD